MDLDSSGETLFRKPGRMELCGYDVELFDNMCTKHYYEGVEFTMQFLPDVKSKDFAMITSVRVMTIGMFFSNGAHYVHHCDGPFTVRNITEAMALSIDEMHVRVDVGVWAPQSLVRNGKTWAYDDMIHKIYVLLKAQKGESDGTDDAG